LAPNPQTPIPNPQSPIPIYIKLLKNYFVNRVFIIIKINKIIK